MLLLLLFPLCGTLTFYLTRTVECSILSIQLMLVFFRLAMEYDDEACNEKPLPCTLYEFKSDHFHSVIVDIGVDAVLVLARATAATKLKQSSSVRRPL